MRGYLPRYDLVAPGSLLEVLALLSESPGTWRPLAGGTDVMVELAAGKLPPGRFVSLWHLHELRGIEVGPEHVTLGGLTTYTQVREHPVVREAYPMLAQAAAESGALAIQNRGTLGGNVVNGSPAADSPPALLAYDAELELSSVRGARWVPYRGFHTGYKQMRREPDELVTRIRMPRHPGGPGHALHLYRKVGTRKAQAISKVCLAALGRMHGDAIAHVRLAYGSVAPVPLSMTRTEAALSGAPLDAEAIEAALEVAAAELSPIDDVRSTAEYRRTVALNLLRDFLERLAAGETTG
jgi:CO/xanthine dehydrogenase FAD-binding subunit